LREENNKQREKGLYNSNTALRGSETSGRGSLPISYSGEYSDRWKARVEAREEVKVEGEFFFLFYPQQHLLHRLSNTQGDTLKNNTHA